jgi:hypothetical protein
MEGYPPQSTVPNRQEQPPRPYSFALPPAPPAELKPIPRWIWITTLIVVLVFAGLAILAVPTFRSLRQQTSLASTAVANLHASMKKGDDDGIFNHADVDYRRQVGQQKSHELFDYVRSRLGAPHTSMMISTFVSADTKAGQVLTLQYQTVFDKGSGTETIKLHKVNGQYLLLGYTVQSLQVPPSEIPADLRSN